MSTELLAHRQTTLGPDLFLKESSIHGTGCFAGGEVPAGDLVVEYVGEKIPRDEAVRRGNPSSREYSEYVFQVNDDLYLDANHVEHAAKYINHCCEPNCSVERIGERIFIKTRRPIRAFEELTIDYSFDEGLGCVCHCGSGHCRGII